MPDQRGAEPIEDDRAGLCQCDAYGVACDARASEGGLCKYCRQVHAYQEVRNA